VAVFTAGVPVGGTGNGDERGLVVGEDSGDEEGRMDTV
jgi:hypothetical protein